MADTTTTEDDIQNSSQNSPSGSGASLPVIYIGRNFRGGVFIRRAVIGGREVSSVSRRVKVNAENQVELYGSNFQNFDSVSLRIGGAQYPPENVSIVSDKISFNIPNYEQFLSGGGVISLELLSIFHPEFNARLWNNLIYRTAEQEKNEDQNTAAEQINDEPTKVKNVLNQAASRASTTDRSGRQSQSAVTKQGNSGNFGQASASDTEDLDVDAGEEVAEEVSGRIPTSTLEASSVGAQTIVQGGTASAQVVASGSTQTGGAAAVSEITSGQVQTQANVSGTVSGQTQTQIGSSGTATGQVQTQASGTSSGNSQISAAGSTAVGGQISGSSTASTAANISGQQSLSGNLSATAQVQSGTAAGAAQAGQTDAQASTQSAAGVKVQAEAAESQTPLASSSAQASGQAQTPSPQPASANLAGQNSGNIQLAAKQVPISTGLPGAATAAGVPNPSVATPQSTPLAQPLAPAAAQAGAKQPANVDIQPPSGLASTLSRFKDNESKLGNLNLGPKATAASSNIRLPQTPGTAALPLSQKTRPDVGPVDESTSDVNLPSRGEETQSSPKAAAQDAGDESTPEPGPSNAELGRPMGELPQEQPQENAEDGAVNQNAEPQEQPQEEEPGGGGEQAKGEGGEEPGPESEEPEQGPEGIGSAVAAQAAAKAEKEKSIAEAIRLVNPEINALLIDGAVWVWALAIPSIGFSVLLGAIVGDLLVFLKKALIRRALNSVLLPQTIVGKGVDADEIADQIKFSGGVKANVVAMNLLVLLLVVGVVMFIGIFIYIGCNWPPDISILRLSGYGQLCDAMDSSNFSFTSSDFLNGNFGGQPPGGGGGSCSPVPSGPASVAQLQIGCFGNNALIASTIAMHESGGQAAIASRVDICLDQNGQKRQINGQDASVSWGLFQINISAHKIGSLNCPAAFDRMYTGANKQCQVIDVNLYNQCVAAAKDPQINIATACQISGNGSNWSAWEKDLIACSIKN